MPQRPPRMRLAAWCKMGLEQAANVAENKQEGQ
jgi:hypothetical protein